MAQESHGLHHYHRRKRIHQGHESYPHPDKAKRFMDQAIYLVGLLGPILTLPQVMIIWVQQNASGVSLVSWIAYLVTACFWLTYGIMHKEKPIIFTNSIWIMLDILIIIGIIIYR